RPGQECPGRLVPRVQDIKPHPQVSQRRDRPFGTASSDCIRRSCATPTERSANLGSGEIDQAPTKGIRDAEPDIFQTLRPNLPERSLVGYTVGLSASRAQPSRSTA